MAPEYPAEFRRRASRMVDSTLHQSAPQSGGDDRAEIRRLQREVAELRTANQILKTTSAFLAAELDRLATRNRPTDARGPDPGSMAVNGVDDVQVSYPAGMTLRNPSTEGTTMGDSGPEEAVKGVVEDVKGKAKEVAGIVSGRDGLREEGRAQQDKAEAQRNVAKKEAEADAARAAEKSAEARQKAAE